MALLLPFNPLTRVQRAAGRGADPARRRAHALRGVAARRGSGAGPQALADLRASDADHRDLHEHLTVGRETATLAPMRWRSRPALDPVRPRRGPHRARHPQRAGAGPPVRGGARDGEPVPPDLPAALATLADASRRCAGSSPPTPSRCRLGHADSTRFGLASAAYAQGVGFSGSVVVAQVRSAVVDLLRATGSPEHKADRWVARAAREGMRAQRRRERTPRGESDWLICTNGPVDAAADACPPRRDRRGARRRAVWLGLLIAICALATIGFVTFLGWNLGPLALGVGITGAILPVPVLIACFLWLDRYQPSPLWIMVVSFLWGAGVATTGSYRGQQHRRQPVRGLEPARRAGGRAGRAGHRGGSQGGVPAAAVRLLPQGVHAASSTGSSTVDSRRPGSPWWRTCSTSAGTGSPVRRPRTDTRPAPSPRPRSSSCGCR